MVVATQTQQQRASVGVEQRHRSQRMMYSEEMAHFQRPQQQQQQQHHERMHSFNEVYNQDMYSEPLYATVVRRKRNVNSSSNNIYRVSPPPVALLEVRYGGREVAHRAATVIQRAYRAVRLQRQFTKLLSLAMSSDRLDRRMSFLGSDPDMERPESKKFPEAIDILILKAAGLSPNFGSGPSARLIKNRRNGRQQDQQLHRSASLRAPSRSATTCAARNLASRSRDDLDLETSPVPPPCPPLRGENFYPHNEPVYVTRDSLYQQKHIEPVYVTRDALYQHPEPVYMTRDSLYVTSNYDSGVTRQQGSAPRPPQRTVSFLAHETLPRKMSQIQKQQQHQQQQQNSPNSTNQSFSFIKPEHSRTSSTPVGGLINMNQQQQHFRTYSSPAPLSPLPPPPPPVEEDMSSGSSSRSESPLPPPPYIPPPSPTRCPDTPLPPPPPVHTSPELPKPRVPSDSGSSASSIDSGFRSSCYDVVTEQHSWQLASPNFIGSPESLASLGDCVFEPRPLSVMPEEIYVPSKRLWVNDQQHEQQQVQFPFRNANSSSSDLYGQIYKNPASPPVNFSRSFSTPKAKKTVRIQTPDVYGQQHNDSVDNIEVNEDDEMTRRRQYRVGLNLFNQHPERGMEYLWKKKFLDYSPAAVAKFLRGRKGLSKKKIGEYLCSLQRPFNLASLHCFIHELDFTGLHLDIALRQLQQEVTFPREAQKIEKFVEVFSKRYIQCNQMFVSGFNSADTVFVLSYAIVLLNTDLHSQALRPSKRMKREDFVRNLNGIDAGANLDEDMLKGIYDRIRNSEFRAGADHVSQVAKVEEAIVGRKRDQGPLAEPHRRLVCFCRLTEVPDIHRKAKRDGAHQRGLFLFNDLLIVCKTVTNKRKTVHQFRYSLPIRFLRINVFSTAQFNYGVQLQDRRTGKVAATFNARSESDQQRFVTDLQEAVAEMAEMEKAEFAINEMETETMC